MRDIVLLIIFAGLIPAVLYRPWIGVLVWSWIGYMNPHKLGWGVVTNQPVAMVFGLLTMAMMLVTPYKKAPPMTRETVMMALLALIFTATTFTAWVPDAAWTHWEKVMKILLFTFVTMVLIYGKDKIKALLVVIAVSIGFYGVKGGLFALRTGGQNMVVGPANSFIDANTSLGLALLMVLPLMVVLGRHMEKKWIKRGFYIAAVLTIIAAIFTYSRGALVGMAAVLPLLFLKTNKKPLILLLLLPLAWIGPDLLPQQLISRAETIETYEEDFSAMQRIQAWGVAWNVALEHPLTGGGFKIEDAPDDLWLSYANFEGERFSTARAAHSIYFQVLGEHGFVAFFLFLALIVSTFMTLLKIKKETKENQELAWMGDYASALQIGLVGYCVSGAFLSLAYFDLFYAYVALAAILLRELRLQRAGATSPARRPGLARSATRRKVATS